MIALRRLRRMSPKQHNPVARAVVTGTFLSIRATEDGTAFSAETLTLTTRERSSMEPSPEELVDNPLYLDKDYMNRWFSPLEAMAL